VGAGVSFKSAVDGSFHFGLGDYNHFGKIHLREEIGAAFQTITSSVDYIEHVSTYDLFGTKGYHTTGEIKYWNGKETKTRTAWFVSLEMYTPFIENTVDLVCQGSFQMQKVSSIQKSDIQSSTLSETLLFLTITPGFAINLDENQKLFFGVRMVSDLSADQMESSFSFFPTIQMEWSL
jgi:hypothetical protein